MVGARGFEPPASCSRSKRATRLRYAPTHQTGAAIAVLSGLVKNPSVKACANGFACVSRGIA